MAKFSFNGNPVLTASEFNEMISTDKGLREARYAGGYSDRNGNHLGNYVNWPSWEDVHDITPEQMETARKRYDERRDEIRREYEQPGTLFIVTMGGDYAPTTPDGIGNHRVRCLFIDKRGDHRGAEFCPFWRAQSNPDESKGFTFDRWNNSEEERKSARYNERMKELTAKYGHEWAIPTKERPEFPLTYADRGTVDDLPFTPDGLIKWFKREHGVKFTRVYIDRHFFSCDEITSVPTPKQSRKK